jgi:hypothetical protein
VGVFNPDLTAGTPKIDNAKFRRMRCILGLKVRLLNGQNYGDETGGERIRMRSVKITIDEAVSDDT